MTLSVLLYMALFYIINDALRLTINGALRLPINDAQTDFRVHDLFRVLFIVYFLIYFICSRRRINLHISFDSCVICTLAMRLYKWYDTVKGCILLL